MTETLLNPELVSLQSQLVAVVAAMNMHVERDEKLAGEAEQLQYEISQLIPGAQK